MQPHALQRTWQTHMKNEPARLAQRYVAALKKHLTQGARASLEPALGLGHQTVAFGLATLDLAKIHESAFSSLMEPGCSASVRATMTKRAGAFFEEANSLFEATSELKLRQLEKVLAHRTSELALANRRIQRGLAQRKVMEDAYEKRRESHHKCLEESLELQRRLRQLTHRVLDRQETERKNISRKLQDDIVQTLVGINVRLLALDQEARTSTKRLKNDIASTQRFVVKFASAVRKSATHEPQAPDLVTPLSNGVAHAPERRRTAKPGGGARARE